MTETDFSSNMTFEEAQTYFQKMGGELRFDTLNLHLHLHNPYSK